MPVRYLIFDIMVRYGFGTVGETKTIFLLLNSGLLNKLIFL